MSRPLSHLLPVACAALSLGFAACVGTIYDPMYTSHRNLHYKPPAAKKEASAEEVLGAVNTNGPAPGGLPTDSSALPPPAAGGEIPGLPAPAATPEAGGAMTPPPLPPAN